MPRIKMWVWILTIMGLALGTAGAQAATVTFNGTHNLSYYVYYYVGPTKTYLNPTTGSYVRAGVSGEAYYPTPAETTSTEQQVNISGTTPQTAAAIGTTGTYLTNINTETKYLGATAGVQQGSMTRNLEALAPNPSGTNPGYVTEQNSYNYFQRWHLEFIAPTAGNYYAAFDDAYSTTFSMIQNAGTPNYFYDMDVLSTVTIVVKAGSYSRTRSFNPLTFSDTNPMDVPLDNYTDTESGIYHMPIAGGEFSYASLPAGALISVDVKMDAYYAGYSYVPLPSTLLLLSSGLGLLGLVGRRKWKRS